MADPFGTGAGIIGVIGLAIQITQVVVQFSSDWKDVPENVKTFMAELGALKTVLSETNTNVLLNPDFAKAFEGHGSLLLSQLGPEAPENTDTKVMLGRCHNNLESLLKDLRKKERSHRLGWERLKSALLAKDTQSSVTALCRQCQALNNMLCIDAAVMGARTYNEVRNARAEQQEWNLEGATTSSAIKSGVEQSNKWQENQDRQVILNWLTDTDYTAQQSDFISRRQPGTGQWLLDSAAFQSWSTSKGQTLFCPGIPGAGKTIITSIVVEQLFAQYHNDKSVSIAYLYCNFRRQHEQRIEDLLASLLKQLAQSLPSLPDAIRSLHESHHEKKTHPAVNELSVALQSVASGCSRTFLIVDAIDECQISDGCRKRLLSEIFDLQSNCQVNIFATSRFIPDITKHIDDCLKVEIRASEPDVQNFLKSHMSRLPSFVERKADLQEEIELAIVKAVDGMFLLAQLHIDSLVGKRSPKAIRAALKCLPGGSDAYDHAYKDAMIRIEGQVADQVQLAKQVLSWIACARRPLTTKELQHALAVETDQSHLDEDNVPDIEDLVSVCAGLVTIDEESHVVRLIHYTTQEYFERSKIHWFPSAENEITAICVAYLSFDIFTHGFLNSDNAFQDRLHENPLFEYAAENWGHHAQGAIESSTFDTELKQAILTLLQNEAKTQSASQGLIATISKRGGASQAYSQRVPKKVVGLHQAAFFGIKTIVESLIEANPENVDTRDSDGQTPLSWAAENGHTDIVRILMDTGKTDLHSTDKQGKTPLTWASLNGHMSTVQMLLDTKVVMPDLADRKNRTPLLWAARKGHEKVVKLLLATGRVDVNSKDTSHGLTPLAWAASNKHNVVVELLLERSCVDADQIHAFREMLNFADGLPYPGPSNTRAITGLNLSWSKYFKDERFCESPPSLNIPSRQKTGFNCEIAHIHSKNDSTALRRNLE